MAGMLTEGSFRDRHSVKPWGYRGEQGPASVFKLLTDPQTDKPVKVKDGILAGRE